MFWGMENKYFCTWVVTILGIFSIKTIWLGFCQECETS